MLASRLLALLPERGLDPDTAPISTPELLDDIDAAREYPSGFHAWRRHWHFRNRETGAELTFARLWPGQAGFADLMVRRALDAIERDWQGIFALKAGKLGFTELECCWDGYVSWARRNGRVHLFSKEEDAAKEMLGYVKFGLTRMEPAWGIRFLDTAHREIAGEKAGTKEFKFTVLRWDGSRDFADVHTVKSFSTSKHPAIDQSCQHGHVDEWAHMEDPRGAWGAIETTIAPGGTCHIVTRGAGENKDVEDAWKSASEGVSKLRAYFSPWSARPDRDRQWLEEQAATLPTLAALSHFAAETPDDAFRGDEDNDFVPIESWDKCFDPSIARWVDDPNGEDVNPETHRRGRWVGNLDPGDNTILIIACDAGVHRDTFTAVAVSRHPDRPADPAIRLGRIWKPEDFVDGVVDMATVQAWLRTICEGGCILGHPQYEPWKGGALCRPRVNQQWAPGECPACAAGQLTPAFNVYQISYDPFQLEDMMQQLRRDGVTWCLEFNQSKPRLEADKTFFDVIIGRRLAHFGDRTMRAHIANAKAKTQKDEESKIRMVKKAAHRKIDYGVAASMAVSECLRLNL